MRPTTLSSGHVAPPPPPPQLLPRQAERHTKQRSSNSSSNNLGGDISSPEAGRKSSLSSGYGNSSNSAAFGGSPLSGSGGSRFVPPQRPSRLPIVSMYNPKMGAMSPTLDMRSPTTRPQLPPPLPAGLILPRKVSAGFVGGGASSPEPLPPPPPLSPKAERHVKRGSIPPGSPPPLMAAGSGCGRRGALSPKRGDISRRVASPTFPTAAAARRRSPSLTRSVSSLSELQYFKKCY